MVVRSLKKYLPDNEISTAVGDGSKPSRCDNTSDWYAGYSLDGQVTDQTGRL